MLLRTMVFWSDILVSVISRLCSIPGLTALIVGGSFLLYFIISLKLGDRVEGRNKEAVFVGTVSQVILYPGKSMRKIADQESLYCDHMGMKTNDGNDIRDRSWMLALEGGSMISLRAEPKLAHIQPSFTPGGEYLQLDAPGMNPLKVSTSLTKDTSPVLDVNLWGLHKTAVHCGKEASNWISEYLGKKGHILVYHPPSMEGTPINDGPLSYHKLFRSDNKTAFADLAPVLLMSESSVEDVVRRVDQKTVKMANFRPNICVRGPDPYEEDKWDTVYIGEKLVLNHAFIVPRCIEVTVDPDTGIMNKDKEPLETMTGYRTMRKNMPCLGVFMSVIQEGEVKVGDSVHATFKKNTRREKQE